MRLAIPLLLLAACEGGGFLLDERAEVREPGPIASPLVPRRYEGTLDVEIDFDSVNGEPFTMTCAHQSLAFSVDPFGALDGEGVCAAWGDRRFAITGEVSGDAVAGEMLLEGQEESMAFAGARGGEGVIVCTFDQTWEGDAGTMRVYGGFTAAPLEEAR